MRNRRRESRQYEFYIKKSQRTYPKPLELISDFRKITGSKINIQKFYFILYLLNKQLESKLFQNAVIASNNISYSEIHFMKDLQNH